MQTKFPISYYKPKFVTYRQGYKYIVCYKFFDTEINRKRLTAYDFINQLDYIPTPSDDRFVQIIIQPKKYWS